ncbi:chemotaxis protein CheB [Succinivibrio sp.]
MWAQNEETCVVYGMPQAIVNANVADLVLPIEDIANCIVKEF